MKMGSAALESICAGILLSGVVGAAAVQAREPGVPPVMPPGQTMGVPIAAPLPEGFYVNVSMAYYDITVRDGAGKFQGTTATVIDPALQLTWVPGWEFLGAKFKMFMVQPIVYQDQQVTYPMPVAQHGNEAKLANGNLQVHPLDLTWTVGPGLFLNAGFSVFAPTGQWGSSEFINIGGNFWTFSPSVALTYLNGGWNFSLQALYFTNTKNTELDYKSGDEFMLSATVTKDIGAGLNVGPVAYYYKQVTSDVNNGTAWGGTIQGNGEKFAIGGAINTQIEKFNVLLMYTYDAYVQDAPGGGKAWVAVSYKFN